MPAGGGCRRCWPPLPPWVAWRCTWSRTDGAIPCPPFNILDLLDPRPLVKRPFEPDAGLERHLLDLGDDLLVGAAAVFRLPPSSSACTAGAAPRRPPSPRSSCRPWPSPRRSPSPSSPRRRPSSWAPRPPHPRGHGEDSRRHRWCARGRLRGQLMWAINRGRHRPSPGTIFRHCRPHWDRRRGRSRGKPAPSNGRPRRSATSRPIDPARHGLCSHGSESAMDWDFQTGTAHTAVPRRGR